MTFPFLILESVMHYLNENEDIRRRYHVFKHVYLIPPLDLVSDVELNTLIIDHVICKPE